MNVEGARLGSGRVVQSRHVTADTQTRPEQEISRYRVLEAPPSRELQALVELAALICDVPTAAINIITSTHQHQIATTGVEPSVCARTDSMCAAVIEEKDAVVSADARLDVRFRTNPFVTGEIGAVRFYASAPLVTRRGVALGRLCVFDTEPQELAEDQGRALEVVAERVVDVLELRLRSQELERSLAELTRTRDELHRSNDRLTRFAGQVSHDLRTPLTAMLLNTELVAEDPAVAEDEQLRTSLGAVMDAGRRMSRLIDDILDFALVGAELRAVEVDLDELVAEVLVDLGPSISDSEAVIEVATGIGAVEGDRQQLYSVLLNLLTNALKFARVGESPRVAVTASDDEGAVRIDIADNGVGIPPEHQERIFDLFTRADGSVPGSGIGLATARAAVEAHRGSLGVSSNDAGGSTFRIVLPRHGQAIATSGPQKGDRR
jgi:signal transduction histidine kinase